VNYLNGKEQVANQDYQAAIRYLLKAVETDPENADVYNLLGYSHRNLEMNDKAFVYYEKALSLDSRHKGAHEYIGELYLKLKQPEKAKEHLAKLDSICFFGCEEFDELKEAIQAYEKNN
jgi:Flp pilus assembly protein TadD